ncbi:1-phosphatidylinositol 4,5-bisphosphate phosphodiesterase zeta-1-like [Leucoraja erinacea]|uniref:1-phosphatidylinositol 4,5-bisphosphate phosphodiesterase zeta-1-like n=1 Tax=Leucoraja erinaceus TaxID=7782 RepID=UPI002454949C|nr:1-phosphatidylinositol 4,5-bisphosphate phosphodiesterase zeta-1-like [Leucoraja erinacea]
MANIYTENYVKAIDKVKHRKFGAEDFIYIYKVFTRRSLPHDLFKQYSSDGKNLTTFDLLYFLTHDQHEIYADEYTALSIMQNHEPVMRSKLKRKLMSPCGFLRYITSTDCCIFNQNHTKVHQRMDLPMTAYFIASSQDTFTNNQSIGQSDISGYISALKRGCRCLELDCWDGPENEPRVYHGFALSSMILVKDVIEVINMHGFETSEYPLILSLEINCNPIQQRVIANHLVNILEDKLIPMNYADDDPTQLSSPEELKHKVLIKCRKVRTLSCTMSSIWHLVDEEEGQTKEEFDPETESEVVSVVPSGIRAFRMKKKRKVGLAMEFSNVIVYLKPVEFKDFTHSRSNQLFYESNSISDQTAMKLVKQSACEFVQHNSKFLVRIYSAGNRRNHSNYKPHEFWNVGCHMVALNYEVPGLSMDLNRGRFQDNGGCGYIRKPDFMTKGMNFDPFASKHNFDPVIALIQIISGHHLPVCRTHSKVSIDPCVRVEIHGVQADNSIQQSKILPSAGRHPRWNDCLVFCVQVPELALVRFLVQDMNPLRVNDFLGQYTLPLTSIRKGYRVVPLLSSDGQSLSPAILFVYVWYA